MFLVGLEFNGPPAPCANGYMPRLGLCLYHTYPKIGVAPPHTGYRGLALILLFPCTKRECCQRHAASITDPCVRCLQHAIHAWMTGHNQERRYA